MLRNNKFIVLRLLQFCSMFAILISAGCSGCSPSSRRSNNQSNSVRSTVVKRDPERQSTSRTERTSESVNHPTSSLSTLYHKYKQSVFMVYTSDGENHFQGSGFFITKSGVAVSNYHVFEGTSQGLEVIKMIDGEEFKIKEVLNKSKVNDYIIFKVDIGNYRLKSPLTLAYYKPQVGEDVFAIGNPEGLESTLSKGIVSALRDNNTLIQTTTEITHGSSGGPLLNMKGEVIGITTSGLEEANLNFAINILKLNLNSYY